MVQMKDRIETFSDMFEELAKRMSIDELKIMAEECEVKQAPFADIFLDEIKRRKQVEE